MRRLLTLTASFAFLSAALAGDMATPDEAKALSEKARAEVDSKGSEQAFAAFADPAGGYQEKDLYVFCMDQEGVMLSHPKKPELIGKNLIDFNKYGDELFKNMIKVAKDPGQGWVDYKWPYPGTEEIKDKTSYVMTTKEGFFCGVGAYK